MTKAQAHAHTYMMLQENVYLSVAPICP